MSDEIGTERLLLRRARLDDLMALHRVMSDPQVMRFWSTPPHSSKNETEHWLQSMIGSCPAESDDFIMTLDGKVIGKLGAWRLPEVGFLVDRAHWGRGLASEALGAFVARRRALGSVELRADVDPRNKASLSLLQRQGFDETHRATRTWLVGNQWCDSVYLKLML